MTDEELKRYNRAYQHKNIKTVALHFSRKSEADIIEWLENLAEPTERVIKRILAEYICKQSR